MGLGQPEEEYFWESRATERVVLEIEVPGINGCINLKSVTERDDRVSISGS